MTDHQPLPSFPGQAGEAQRQSESADYASWGRRVVAYLLDGVVISVIATLVAVATGHHDLFNTFRFHLVNGKQQLEPYGSALDFFVGTTVVLQILYAAFLATSWRATPGMRALGIYIARESDGGRVGLGRAGARAIVLVVASELLQLVLRLAASLLALLDLLWPLWDARNQTLHDKVARTVVLRRAPTS
jgi:uncharacterized RDD family membrane protein YckC